MKSIFLIFISFFIAYWSFSQQFNFPTGYKSYKDYDGKEVRIDKDFDNDGITDLAILCKDKNESVIAVVYLTSNYVVKKTYYWFPWVGEMYMMEYKNNVLTIGSTSCAGRCYTNLLLKYYANLKNMKLIGYADGNLGNYQNDGAYDKNINLNTGEYEIGGVKRKVSIDQITLSNIEKYFDYLSSVGSNYIGK